VREEKEVLQLSHEERVAQKKLKRRKVVKGKKGKNGGKKNNSEESAENPLSMVFEVEGKYTMVRRVRAAAY
jgi:hypothetical protein